MQLRYFLAWAMSLFLLLPAIAGSSGGQQGGGGAVSSVNGRTGDVTGLAEASDATNASNLSSGTIPAGRLPNPGASTLGGVNSKATESNKFLTGIGVDGAVSNAQPSFSNLLGTASRSQGGTGLTGSGTDTTKALMSDGAEGFVMATPPSFDFLKRVSWFQCADNSNNTSDVIGAASTALASGTPTGVASDADGSWLSMVTGSSSGNAAYYQIAAAQTGRARQTKPVLYARIKTPSSLANCRIWVGLTTTNVNGVSNLNNIHGAALRYDTGVDGTAFWRTSTNDGSGTAQEFTTTSAIAVNSAYNVKIDMTGQSTADFYVNNTLVKSETVQLPGSTTKLYAYVGITTLTGSSTYLYMSKTAVVSN